MDLPEGINETAWNEFEQHRKDIKHPLTDLARRKAWNLLQNYSYQEQQRTIDESIISGWRGLFPKKTNSLAQWTGSLYKEGPPSTKFQRMSKALAQH